jgi:CheY-like chemotaxis protein
MATFDILMIEDLEIAQNAAISLFSQLDCDISIAETAASGLEQLLLRTFDIIFIDLQLPDMNGFELAETIRHMEKRLPKLPLIAVTANSNEELAHKVKSAGFDDYLLKPLSIEAIRYILSKHLLSLEQVL